MHRNCILKHVIVSRNVTHDTHP